MIASKMNWQPIETAPKDGSSIIGLCSGEECSIMWSDNPVCMLGSRCGSFDEGWATDGTETDRNLPVADVTHWRPRTDEQDVEL